MLTCHSAECARTVMTASVAFMGGPAMNCGTGVGACGILR